MPTQSLATPLQVFAQMGGLALLAKHLPLVYPQALRIQPPEAAKGPSPDPMEADWVKVEVSEDFLDVSCLQLTQNVGLISAINLLHIIIYFFHVLKVTT